MYVCSTIVSNAVLSTWFLESRRRCASAAASNTRGAAWGSRHGGWKDLWLRLPLRSYQFSAIMRQPPWQCLGAAVLMFTAGTRPHGRAHAGVLCRFNKDNELLTSLRVYAVQRGGGGWRHQGVASYLPTLESASCMSLLGCMAIIIIARARPPI